MNWKKRKAQIERLKAANLGQRYRVPFPDLTVREVAPCSNRFDSIHDKSRAEPYVPPKGVIVDHLHKSSLQVLLPSELPWAGGKKP